MNRPTRHRPSDKEDVLAMMRSLFAGVSGLTTHQTRMDVIGNNIANVNTIGFKKSRATFQDMLSQTLRNPTAPTATRGGVNPVQVGLGVQLGSVDVIHTAGATEPTGVGTDLSIEGNGFFVMLDGDSRYFTRAGAFTFDEDGWLSSPANGLRVAGWNADRDGNIDSSRPIEPLQVSFGETLPAQATSRVAIEGNLDARVVAGPDSVHRRTVEVIDSLGVVHQVILVFQKTRDNAWSWEAVNGDGELLGSGDMSFTDTGNYIEPDTVPSFTLQGTGGAADMTVEMDFNLISQFGEDTDLDQRSQNGFPSGHLVEVRIDAAGILTGIFSNGLTRSLGQIALATFSNNGGLLRAGQSLFEQSRNSGLAQIGLAGTGDRGRMTPGTLEMSNVDLSEEFTSMIITQRGFQANSRIITTSDEMLQELVNLKR